MSKIFVEYQILPEYRPAYAKWVRRATAICPQLEVYEGTDQPGLFVEMWDGATHEEYRAMKQLRQPASGGEESPTFAASWAELDWSHLPEWVKGGPEKIHIWHFEKVK